MSIKLVGGLKYKLAALATLQLFANIFTQLIILWQVGAGHETDAYIAAQTVPLVIFSILSVSFQSVWQPRFSIAANNSDEWKQLQGVAQGQMLLGFWPICLLLWLSDKVWVSLLFPGFDNHQLQLAISMIAPFLISAAFNSHSVLYTTALRAQDRFLISELVPLISTLLMMIAIYFAVPYWGIESAAFLALTRAAIVCLVLNHLSERPSFLILKAIKNKEVLTQIRILVLGTSFYKTSPLVDRYWSSQSSAGGVTIFSLAQMAMSALATILDKAICVPVTPKLARMVADCNFDGVRKIYRHSVLQVTIMTALMGLILLMIYPVWTDILVSWLKLSPQLANDMWFICIALLGYMHVGGSGSIAVAAFYAMGDVRTPVSVGVIGFAAGVVIKSVFFVLLGLKGLAIGTSIYYVCNMVVMCVLLEKKINGKLS